MDEAFEPGDRLLAIAGASVRHAIHTGDGFCVFSDERGEVRRAPLRDWAGPGEIAYRLEPWSRHRGEDAARRALAGVGSCRAEFAGDLGRAFATWCLCDELPPPQDPAPETWTERLARTLSRGLIPRAKKSA